MFKKKYYMVNVVTKEVRAFRNFRKLWDSYSKQPDKRNILAVKGKEINTILPLSITWKVSKEVIYG
ncbi:hypothetical protein BuS5_04012 (plasmid) [Desulfosarcina sp. BuS5]|nr:hypothetical protein BuS5_04012 [Desulfosarcina sp. BuS5]